MADLIKRDSALKGYDTVLSILDSAINAVSEAKAVVLQYGTEPQWIPCSERLPEEYGNYLATMDDGDVQECTYSPEKNTPFMRGGWSTCEADGIVYLDIAEVIAWTPLPERYKGE